MRYPHEDDADYEAIIGETSRRIRASQTWSGADADNPQFKADTGLVRTVPQIAADVAYEILGTRLKLKGVRAFDMPALEREQAARVPGLEAEIERRKGEAELQSNFARASQKEAEEWKRRFDKLLDMAMEKR